VCDICERRIGGFSGERGDLVRLVNTDEGRLKNCHGYMAVRRESICCRVG
jgi:hypothetical protein